MKAQSSLCIVNDVVRPLCGTRGFGLGQNLIVSENGHVAFKLKDMKHRLAWDLILWPYIHH